MHQMWVFLIVLGFTLTFISISLSKITFAQDDEIVDFLRNQTLYEVVKQSSGLGENPQISVGVSPEAIIVKEGGKEGTEPDAIYVANFGSNTVSVISGENNTKIGEDIPVGEGPLDIDAHQFLNKIYVANSGSDSISVISGENNTILEEEIPIANTNTLAVDTLNDKIYAYNSSLGTISVISATENYEVEEEIDVEYQEPSAIAIREGVGTIYTAGSGAVYVINSSENYEVEEEILPIGDEPAAIAVQGDVDYGDTLYVANSESDTVSVIKSSGDDMEVVKNITVGHFPRGIAVYGDTLYVANSESDTVSVINSSENYEVEEEIPVGDEPLAIDVNEGTGTIYVANRVSNGVSVIDGTVNKVAAGVTFNINPFNSGYVVCEDLTTPSPDDLTPPSPIGQYTYVYSGTECTAKPSEGFEFVSWEENLQGNATQPLQVSGSGSTWDSFVLAITDLFGDKPDKPEAILNVTKFGTFTANFKELPPPVPQEFWAQMYAVIATVITALFIPSIVGWFKSKRDAKKLNYFHKQVADLYKDDKLDENDIEALDHLRNRIGDAYSEGKLNEKHYESLKGETSALYEEIFRKKIVALDGKSNDSAVGRPAQEQLAQIRDDIKYAFSKGKINEKHYALLNEDISKLESKEGDTP